MIDAFFSTWELFQQSYISGWILAALLAAAGVTVVARDQIFIGAAAAQASTLGIALAILLAGAAPESLPAWLGEERLSAFFAVGFSIAAAVFSEGVSRGRRDTHEAVTGWVFLAAASLSVLLVAHSPHGLEEVHRLLFSTIIGATWTDVAVLAVLAAAAGLALGFWGRPLILLTQDPETFGALAGRSGLWRYATAAAIGLLVGVSLRVSGLLYTFGFLVLPALAAKEVCRTTRALFLVAPVAALLASSAGFVTAGYYDFPLAQMSVAVLALGTALLRIARLLPR